MEKKAILVFAFLFAMSIIAKSQVNTSIINQKTFGGSNMDYPSSGVVCIDGSYVIGGTSLSSNTGDKTDPGRGMQDYWIVKYDPSLSVVWQKTYGGSGEQPGGWSPAVHKQKGFIC
jgi:hypothetical protein